MIDTPWDEPSDSSPEYMAYLTGELLNYDPWTRIQGPARCESNVDERRLTSSNIVGHVDSRPKRQIDDGRNKDSSMVNDVSCRFHLDTQLIR